jgi:hypothetical protein
MDKNLINTKAQNIAKDIIENSKNVKSYGTGLLFEHYLVGTLENLPIDKLKTLRHLITKIIYDKEHIYYIKKAKGK